MKSLIEAVGMTPMEREHILPSYLQKILPKAQIFVNDEPPIEAHVDDWIHLQDPKRLSRTFYFENRQHLTMFMFEVLKYEEVTQHYADFVIKDMIVRADVWTHDLNDVTQTDIDYAREIDSIFEDVKFFS